MKTWFFSKITAAKSFIAVICAVSLVATGITGCGASQPDGTKSVSNTTGGEDNRQENATQQSQTDVQEKEAYKLPQFDVEEEKPIEVDVDEDWPVEYLLAGTGDGSGVFSGDSGYPRRDGFEVYAFAPENVKCGYDNKNGFSIIISDTGSEDWHIQLKKNGVKVENEKWYKVTFDAKSSIDRSIIFSMQRDGSADEDWRSYSGNKTVQLGNEWKPYTIYFRMTDDTDNKAIYNFSMGTVGGNRIRQQHTVNIKNMQFEELEDTWLDQLGQEGNLLKNPKFEYDDIAWEASVVEPGAATVKFENGKAVYDISNVGTADWHIQLKQDSIPMEHGYNYRLTFKASSTASRSINIGFMDKNFVHWYGGSLEALNAGAERTVAVEFYMDKATDKNACMFISMGKIDNMNTPASVITLSDFMLEKLPGRPVSSGSWTSSDGEEWKAPIISLGRGWEVSYWFGEVGKCYEDAPGSYVIEILDTGSLDWHVQMQKKGIVVKNGRTYRMSFEAKSSVGRKIGCAIQKDGTNDGDWKSYSGGSGKYELNSKWQTFSEEFAMTSATDRNAIFNISLGAVDRVIKDKHTVYIRNIKLEDITDEPIASVPIGEEMLTGEWDLIPDNAPTKAKKTEKDGIVTVEVLDVGTEDHHVQIKKSGLTIEEGCTYEFKCNAAFDNGERTIKVGIMDPTDNYAWYGGEDFTINSTSKECKFTFKVEKPTINTGMLAISLGKIAGENTPTGKVTLSNISLMKTKEAENPDDPSEPDIPEDSGLKLIADDEDNLLKGKNFELTTNGSSGDAKISSDKTRIKITNVGSADWNIQLKLAAGSDNKLALEKDCTYEFTADAKFDAADGETKQTRTIKVGFLSQGDDWYDGKDSKITSTSSKIDAKVKMTTTDDNVKFVISMGKIDGEDTPKGTVTLSNLLLVEKSGGDEPEPEIPAAPENLYASVDGNMLVFSKIKADCIGVNGATATSNDAKTQFDISNVGDESWKVSIEQENLQMVNGHKYRFKGTVYSSTARKIEVCIQSTKTWTKHPDDVLSFAAGEKREIVEEFTYNYSGEEADSVRFFVGMGKVDDGDAPGIIQLSEFSLVDLDDVGVPTAPASLLASVDGNMLDMDNILSGNMDKDGASAIPNGTLTQFDISALGTASWNVSIEQKNLPLIEGHKYRFSGKVYSSTARNIEVLIQSEKNWVRHAEADPSFAVGETKDIVEEFTYSYSGTGTDSVRFFVGMGKVADSDEPGIIQLSEFSLVDLSAAEEPDESNLTLIAAGDDNLLKDCEPWVNGATRDGTKLEINSVGANKWDVQLGFSELPLVSGATYTATCRIKSSVSRKITVGVQDPSGNPQYGGEYDQDITDGWREFTFVVNEDEGIYNSPVFYISMGSFGDGDPTAPHTITICDISLVKNPDASTSVVSMDKEGTTFSSDTVIEESSLDSEAVEEDDDEDVTDENPEAVEEIQENTDEEAEDGEEIQEDSDENLKTDEETPEDTPNDYIIPETVDISLNEDNNGSDDSN